MDVTSEGECKHTEMGAAIGQQKKLRLQNFASSNYSESENKSTYQWFEHFS